ncbi:MAG: hypothetical protein JW798_00270 [Prolixibacteraceae bacterium]|nr:hypothetical protein [Prolixibacteraceae bacterium]
MLLSKLIRICIIGKVFITMFLLLANPKSGKAFIFNFTRNIDSIQLIYNDQELRLPGKSFEIGAIVYYKKGKVRKTWNLEEGFLPWFSFNVEVKGGRHFLNKIIINEKLVPSAGKYISVKVWPGKAKDLAKTLLLPLNYEKQIEIVPTSDVTKAPGYSFHYKIIATYDNDIVEEFRNRNWITDTSRFSLRFNGGRVKWGQFIIESDIRKIENHQVDFTAISKLNPECTYTLGIDLDYIANYKLVLSGAGGSWGGSGFSGSSGLSGNDGSDGEDGSNGSDGGRGPDIGVWTDLYFDSLLQMDLLYVYAENLFNKAEYRCLVNPNGGKITVVSRGGAGGDGGSGGSGGSGGKGSDGEWHSVTTQVNDSTEVTKRWQDKGENGGNGGDGGNGGNGGDGGDGGDVYLYFTQDALPFQHLIIPLSEGGSGGSSGSSGSGGSAGTGGTGDPSGSSGSSGNSGWSGNSGSRGIPGYIYIDTTNMIVDMIEYGAVNDLQLFEDEHFLPSNSDSQIKTDTFRYE